jgi:hypothetical protein
MFVALSEKRQVKESKDMSVKAKTCQGKHRHVSESKDMPENVNISRKEN